MSTATATIPRNRRRSVILVFNPTHFADDVQVAGNYFHFDPRSVGKCHCAHHQVDKGEDPTGVHEIVDWPRTDRGHLIMDGGTRSREVVMDAQKVADLIVSPDCRGEKGYVILEGTPQEQEEQKRFAVEKWVTFHLAEVEQEIAVWEAHVADLRQMRPGDPPPRRPRRVVAAYQFRDNHLEMVGRAATFVCDLCGWDGLEAVPPQPDTAASLANHRRRAHPGVTLGEMPVPVAALPAAPARATTDSPTAGELEEERQKEGMGDSPDSTIIGGSAAAPGASAVPREADEAGKAVTIRANQLGMELSVADKKGLHHGDVDVIKDVEIRLVAFKKAQALAKKKEREKE